MEKTKPEVLLKKSEFPKGSLQAAFSRWLGQPVAILCMRYWYRGILAEIGESYVILTNPTAVEQSGPATGDHPTHEDVIPSDLIIKTMAIEIMVQPAWAWHGFNKKDFAPPAWPPKPQGPPNEVLRESQEPPRKR
jgi:hypothetical protein